MRIRERSIVELEKLVRENLKRSLCTERFSGVVEELIEEISELGGTLTIQYGQWFGVDTKGRLVNYQPKEVEKDFTTRFTGESLVMVLIKTYKAWVAEWEKFTGRKWNDHAFRVIEE